MFKRDHCSFFRIIIAIFILDSNLSLDKSALQSFLGIDVTINFLDHESEDTCIEGEAVEEDVLKLPHVYYFEEMSSLCNEQILNFASVESCKDGLNFTLLCVLRNVLNWCICGARGKLEADGVNFYYMKNFLSLTNSK